MKALFALMRIDLKLALRNRAVLFFNYFFPLIFFFVFAQLFDAKQGAAINQVITMVLALALINDPQMLFLDEPTTGLDPQVRLEIRDLIEELRAEKRTIVMTTHYIEEAERLCDRVAIIDAGQIIAIGSPREPQEKSASQSGIEATLSRPAPAGELPAFQEAIRSTLSEDRRHLTISSKRPGRTLVEMVKWIDSHGIELDDVHLKRPTLEDVFLELTGKKLRD